MGLDMYLYRREHLSNYSWGAGPSGIRDKEKAAFQTIVDALGIEPCEHSPTLNVEVCVAYWRKANAIHGYIVREHGGGVDKCQSIYLTRNDLKVLRDKCDEILCVPANFMPNVAEKCGLNTVEGFFFGSTDYDEWYTDDLKRTVNQIDKILESTSEDSWTDFIYRASW